MPFPLFAMALCTTVLTIKSNQVRHIDNHCSNTLPCTLRMDINITFYHRESYRLYNLVGHQTSPLAISTHPQIGVSSLSHGNIVQLAANWWIDLSICIRASGELRQPGGVIFSPNGEGEGSCSSAGCEVYVYREQRYGNNNTDLKGSFIPFHGVTKPHPIHLSLAGENT